jgi:hexosaminidase
MDEVYYDCWESNPDIKQFMTDHNMTKTEELEQYYVKKTIENVKKIGYKYMTWQDPIDNGVEMSADTIVEVWKDTELVETFKRWDEYIIPIAEKKYKMVLSACWYLNYISYGPDWKKYYNCDPHNFSGTTQQKDLVIGGEACLWSEYIDGTNLLSRLWPRASAVAEKLWSNSLDTNNTDNAQFRLDEHRCRMLRRGVPAAPILNGYCGHYEWDIERPLKYIGDKSNSYSLNTNNTIFTFVLILLIVFN